MAETAQDRHLPASARKIQKAREDGQVARSRDLGHFGAIAAGLVWVVDPVRCLNADCYEFLLWDWLADAASFTYFYLLAPFCWFVAWLRVSEAQVSHGV